MSQPKNNPNSKLIIPAPMEPDSAEPTKTRAIDGKTLAGVLEEAKASPPALVVIAGRPLGKYFLLTKETMTLGRELTADISISETAISRKHTDFLISSNGVEARDLGSTNGTFINDIKLATNASQLLNDGDLIRCGSTLFKFVREGQVETPAGLRNYDSKITDGLTGINNRKSIIETIQEEFARAQAKNSPLSFILFDIDHFKKTNDTFGHPAGDYVLREICDLIKTKMIRQRDAIGRYGGEEFALLLPQTPLHIAVEVAERIRSAIEKHAFIFEEQPIPVTISLGLVALDSSSKTSDELISLADKALYDAKNQGRNRVCVR
ncbi:MAG: GGDEF domain-containing protein [Bdellovibrionales bacterium]|nr:GGDEF domain-containing protein [Bdellovibrionales bacterium]